MDAKGFPGVQAIHTAFKCGLVVDAGGTSAGTGSSGYGINTDTQGVQLVFGSGTTFELGEWRIENVGTSSVYPAHVANLTAWVGMQVGSKYSVGRLKDATAETGFGVTDSKLAELLSKYPVGYRPNYWLMNRRSAFQLQVSRSTAFSALGAKSATGAEVFAPLPLESNGIPIVITDSIASDEVLS